MKIIVNGAAQEVGAATLAEALVELGYAGALNGDFVPAAARDRALAAGDQLEILAPRQGG
jgi:sulfur carrier protein